MNTKAPIFYLTCALAASLLASSPAYAYIGPGAGLSAFGSLIALVFAVVVALLGFVWFPIKRLFRNKNSAISDEEELLTETEKDPKDDTGEI